MTSNHAEMLELTAELEGLLNDDWTERNARAENGLKANQAVIDSWNSDDTQTAFATATKLPWTWVGVPLIISAIAGALTTWLLIG